MSLVTTKSSLTSDLPSLNWMIYPNTKFPFGRCFPKAPFLSGTGTYLLRVLRPDPRASYTELVSEGKSPWLDNRQPFLLLWFSERL